MALSKCLRKLFSLILNIRLVEHLNVKLNFSAYQFGVEKNLTQLIIIIFIIGHLLSYYRTNIHETVFGFLIKFGDEHSALCTNC